MTKVASPAFFEQLYAQHPDPWSFASSSYELSRYAATIEALGNRRFKRAIEPGCSIGVLTEKLASVADQVDACDVSPTAVQRARERCQHLRHVRLSVGEFNSSLAAGKFDLLVLSEIGYYFPELELTRIAQEIIWKLSLDGIVLAVHWLGHSADHALSGDRVHELLESLNGVEHEWGERNQKYRIDRWRRV